MARKDRHVSETPATQWLRRNGIEFTEHAYDYVEHGGTAESARQLGVDEHAVVKTLVMQDERAQPLVVLMHGDRQVSTKNLAREIGVKSVEPCRPDVAQRHSGYIVGGTSPFGFRREALPRVRAAQRARAAAHLHQRRAARLPGRHRRRPCCQDRWARRPWTAP
jgi:Cys-tRNA(Pro) deacylase